MNTYDHINSTTSSSGSSGCSSGYSKYSTSNGHCCREEFPYYYDGLCQSCPEGYEKYNSSNGHCCPDGYPYYYDGNCWNQPEGRGAAGAGMTGTGSSGADMMSGTTGSGTTGSSSTSVSTTAGTSGEGGPHLVRGKCPSGTYYYQGACWKQRPESSTTASSPTGSGTVAQTTYYASCSECQGQYLLYSYRGPSYGVCHSYYVACVENGCMKILDNCP